MNSQSNTEHGHNACKLLKQPVIESIMAEIMSPELLHPQTKQIGMKNKNSEGELKFERPYVRPQVHVGGWIPVVH